MLVLISLNFITLSFAKYMLSICSSLLSHNPFPIKIFLLMHKTSNNNESNIIYPKNSIPKPSSKYRIPILKWYNVSTNSLYFSSSIIDGNNFN